jgi:hypothetical protein
MTTFKVGDRVRLKDVNVYDRWGAKGKEGTVIDVGDGDENCLVEFDKAGRWLAGRHILEPVAPAPTTYLPEPGGRVLIEATVTGATTSKRGTHYNVTLQPVGGKKVSLHFLADDLIILPDYPADTANDNGPLPPPDTAKAFDALGALLRALAINPSAAFRSSKEAA